MIKGFFIHFLFLSSAFGALIYVPSNLRTDTASVVVVIHGCLQSAESMSLGTGWNQIADKNNLVIIYPQVPEGSNPLACWNWYLAENQRADRGQLKVIFDEIQSTQKSLQLNNPKTYVAGISSGATTAAGLISCFPNSFSAAALHSGPSYGLARSLFEGDRVLKDGPPEKKPDAPCSPESFQGSVILIQGSDDDKVNPKNAAQVIADFASQAKTTPTKEFKEGEISFEVTDYWTQTSLKLRFVSINQFGHAWSGFVKNLRHASFVGPEGKYPTQVPFFSKVGPSSTNLIWDFFNKSNFNK